MTPLEWLEHDLSVVGSVIEKDLANLASLSELEPGQEDITEENVWEGFLACVETGDMSLEQASKEFYVWRGKRLGHTIVIEELIDLPGTSQDC